MENQDKPDRRIKPHYHHMASCAFVCDCTPCTCRYAPIDQQDKSDKPDNSVKSDKAREVYEESLSCGNMIEPPIDDKLSNLPYVVIGDFAYLWGLDHVIWMAPLKTHVYLKSDRTRVTDRSPDWAKAVDVTWFEANLTKRNEWISDLLIALNYEARRMADHAGVKVETPHL